MDEDSKDGLNNGKLIIPTGVSNDCIVNIVPPLTITFHVEPGASKPVGTLFLDAADGKLKFEGDMAESAKIFFEGFLKLACDDYIKERLEKAKETLRKYGRHLRSCELVKQPYLPSTDSHWVCTCGFSEAMNCQTCGKEGYVVDLPLPKGGYTTRHCPECGAI